jgi:hypothetical protein
VFPSPASMQSRQAITVKYDDRSCHCRAVGTKRV